MDLLIVLYMLFVPRTMKVAVFTCLLLLLVLFLQVGFHLGGCNSMVCAPPYIEFCFLITVALILNTGFTRRFQPEKPTTKGQAAIALASGDAADNVAEELARLEAEAMTEKAVAADIAMELHAQRDISDDFNKQLQAEKEKREQAEKLIEEVRSELQKAKAERDEERYSVLKDRATLDSEKELLNVLRQQVDEQLQAFSGLRVEVAAEKERLEKLRVEREEQLKAISNYKLELEVERRALTLVRFVHSQNLKNSPQEMCTWVTPNVVLRCSFINLGCSQFWSFVPNIMALVGALVCPVSCECEVICVFFSSSPL